MRSTWPLRRLFFGSALPSDECHPTGTRPFVRLSKEILKSGSITNPGPFSHCPGLARSLAILPVAMEEASTLLSTIDLDDYTIKEVQNGWETTEKRLGGPKMAGEEVFGKLKAELPRTGGMLKRSSTVWHLLNELLQSLSDPKVVQKKLEYIALRHMNADITTADVEVFKGILLEVCASKLGGLMTPEFQFGLG
ncbi:unnamed protein product [Symbiodinium sp. CCMP2592]|nr:unnamed protein product [Symbiodinium sp. CCMP2592]